MRHVKIVQQLDKTYPCAAEALLRASRKPIHQLAALSKMSIELIRELAQLSLLDERDGRFGFRDLASARQIAKLLNDGCPPLGNYPRRQRNWEMAS
jgi:hypothetical protein